MLLPMLTLDPTDLPLVRSHLLDVTVLQHDNFVRRLCGGDSLRDDNFRAREIQFS